MAQLPSTFDSSQHDTMGDFSPIPDGDYVAQIVESEMKTTKAGTGQYLQLVFQIIQGEHKNKKLWVRLNLVNPNQTAVNIAQDELATITRAAYGHDLNISDSTQLHGKPMLVTVKFVPATQKNPAGNDVKFYKHLGAAGANPQAPADPTKGAEATPAGGPPEWG